MTSARKPRRAASRVSTLFFLLSALGWFGRGFGLCLRVGGFHRLAVLFGPFGADLGALLTLFVEHLFAAQQFDERLLGAVALAPRGTDDAQISAVSISEAGSHGIEKLADRFVRHQVC